MRSLIGDWSRTGQKSIPNAAASILFKNFNRAQQSKFLLCMASILRGFRAFWKGSGPPIPPKNKHPPPWPCPRPPRFRPTRPPKPTTLVGKIKSYIPSRRWLIAGGIIGAWIGLAAYDRRERKRAVERWCKKVEHLSRRTIQFSEDVPSIAIWIGAPPGDQLKWNKEVWRDYVKVLLLLRHF